MTDSGLKRGELKTGTATITAGNTSITVTHGFYTTPYSVTAAPNDIEAVDWYVPTADIGATTFKIYITAIQAGDVSFRWIAAVS